MGEDGRSDGEGGSVGGDEQADERVMRSQFVLRCAKSSWARARNLGMELFYHGLSPLQHLAQLILDSATFFYYVKSAYGLRRTVVPPSGSQ